MLKERQRDDERQPSETPAVVLFTPFMRRSSACPRKNNHVTHKKMPQHAVFNATARCRSRTVTNVTPNVKRVVSGRRVVARWQRRELQRFKKRVVLGQEPRQNNRAATTHQQCQSYALWRNPAGVNETREGQQSATVNGVRNNVGGNMSVRRTR